MLLVVGPRGNDLGSYTSQRHIEHAVLPTTPVPKMPTRRICYFPRYVYLGLSGRYPIYHRPGHQFPLVLGS